MVGKIISFARLRARLTRRLPSVLYTSGTILLLLAAIIPARPAPKQELLILRDVSASMPASVETPDFLSSLKASADHVEEILFAGQARRAQLGETDASLLEPDKSDYASALAFADSLPRHGEVRRRILLIGDGRENVGDMIATARGLAGSVLVEALPVGSQPAPDARIVSFTLPGVVASGKIFNAEIFLTGSAPVSAKIFIKTQRGELLAETEAIISPAGVQINLPLTLREPGLIKVLAEVALAGDIIPANDLAETATLVKSAPALLWLGRNPPSFAPENITVIPPGEITPDKLRKFSCLVLDDVSATDLPQGSGKAILDAVSAGVGLLAVGGKNSLGAGGYDQAALPDTPLADLLPVRMNPTDSLALAVLLDSSGSMEENVSGGSKLSLAASAILALWEKLLPGDKASLLTFAEDSRVLLPLIDIEEKNDPAQVARLREALFGLRARGGTKLFGGLELALHELAFASARRKHLIVITDGDTMEKDADELLRKFSQSFPAADTGISIIAVGDDPQKELLSALAALGKGKPVWAHDRLLSLPEILDQSLREHREYLRADGAVGKIGRHEITRNFKAQDFPPLQNYLAVGPAYTKRGATVLLANRHDEPLAAAWRLGLGRVAVTAGSPWADWQWDKNLSRDFLTRLLSWCEGETEKKYHVSISPTASNLQLTLAVDKDISTPAEYLARIVEPLREDAPIFPLFPLEPNLWRGTCPLPAPGLHRIDLIDRNSGDVLAAFPFSPRRNSELTRFGVDGSALFRLVTATGGSLIYSAANLARWEDVPVSGTAPAGNTPAVLLLAGIAFILAGLAVAALR
jgi:hypothetical protein